MRDVLSTNQVTSKNVKLHVIKLKIDQIKQIEKIQTELIQI